MKKTDRTVRDWTEEDERKYREMLATPLKKPTEEELFKLTSASPNPPLGASLGKDEEDKELIEKLKNPPQFEPFNSDLFTEKIAETANKTAQVSHDLEMKRIKAKLIADLCVKFVELPMTYGEIPIRAREIAENALKEI